jgi:hypothetical protein
MADTSQGQQQTNGTPRSPTVLPAPSNAARAAARIRAGRAQTLAALESGNDLNVEAAPEAVAAAKAPAPVESPAVDEREVEAVETTDDAEVEDAPPARVEVDAESSKRLATIQAAEKRSREKIAKEREQLAADRASIEKERQELAAARSEIEAYRAARERAKLDPVAYLKAAGVDDLEYAARQAYATAKAGTDPQSREAAARMMREREHETELQATKRRLEELEQRLSARDQQAQFESHKNTYIEHAVKAIGDDAPITKALAAKNPAKVRAALWATTEHLIAENDGDVPDFEDVITTYERARRAELDELGIDPATLTAAPAAKKQNDQPADKKHPAKTLGNDLSTPRVPRPTKSDKEHRAETLAMLERGTLE